MDVFEQWGRAWLRLASVEIRVGTTGIKQMGPFLFFFSARKFLEHIMHKEGRPAADLCERSTNTCSYPTEAG